MNVHNMVPPGLDIKSYVSYKHIKDFSIVDGIILWSSQKHLQSNTIFSL